MPAPYSQDLRRRVINAYYNTQKLSISRKKKVYQRMNNTEKILNNNDTNIGGGWIWSILIT
jgi:uncharacterized ubiquitin-like protein YukD